MQGSRPKPYNITIGLPALTEKQWEKAIEAMAGQAIFAAKLLAGEMPQDIEDAFKAAGVPLFPKSPMDIDAECSCPDFANPCKHIAAVYYLLGEQFDEDPFLLFVLRGRTKDEIIDSLRALRATFFEGIGLIDEGFATSGGGKCRTRGIVRLEAGQENFADSPAKHGAQRKRDDFLVQPVHLLPVIDDCAGNYLWVLDQKYAQVFGIAKARRFAHFFAHCSTLESNPLACRPPTTTA